MTILPKSPPLPQMEVAQLDQLYTFRSRHAVLEFLEENPDLMPILLAAPAQIARYFPDPTLALEFRCDPESTIADCHISLYIATEFGVENSLTRLDQLDNNWALEALDPVGLRMLIDVEY